MNNLNITRFSPEFLAGLINEATQSPRARQHRNIHSSYDDPCQRFLNAIGMESYIRPHRHSLEPKAETLLAVRGLFALVTFDDDGTLQEVMHFGTEQYTSEYAEGLSAGADLSPGIWHTIIALVPGSVLLELKAGPFNPNAAKEPAPWAPEEGTHEGMLFLDGLRKLAAL